MGLFSDSHYGSNESEEQPAFWRTHNARERARMARVKAQRDRKAKAAKAKKTTVKVRGQKKK